MIEAEDVWKVFDGPAGPVEAVRGVSLTASPGEFVAVRGASGSGKSTLLGLVGGLERPTRGRLTVAGVRLDDAGENALSSFRRTRVGFVFQSFHLIPGLTAAENVALPSAFTGGRLDMRRARLLLGQVGLAARADFRPGRLSGGEQQRVAVARALMNEPALVLADEPTGQLDAATGDAVMRLLREHTVAAGRTLLVVTHDESVAAGADRVLFLKDGRLASSS